MLIYGKSEKGPVREKNEDSFALEMIGNYLCMAVADGVGGEVCGEIASKIAVDSSMNLLKKSVPFVKERDELPSLLKQIFNNVNIDILHDCLEHRERLGMCTTLTIALIKDTELTIAHIGDTRGYLLHASELIKLTEDHERTTELIKKGIITEEEAKDHPDKGKLCMVYILLVYGFGHNLLLGSGSTSLS